jgi:hypothetical protein
MLALCLATTPSSPRFPHSASRHSPIVECLRMKKACNTRPANQMTKSALAVLANHLERGCVSQGDRGMSKEIREGADEISTQTGLPYDAEATARFGRQTISAIGERSVKAIRAHSFGGPKRRSPRAGT